MAPENSSRTNTSPESSSQSEKTAHKSSNPTDDSAAVPGNMLNRTNYKKLHRDCVSSWAAPRPVTSTGSASSVHVQTETVRPKMASPSREKITGSILSCPFIKLTGSPGVAARPAMTKRDAASNKPGSGASAGLGEIAEKGAGGSNGLGYPEGAGRITEAGGGRREAACRIYRRLQADRR